MEVMVMRGLLSNDNRRADPVRGGSQLKREPKLIVVSSPDAVLEMTAQSKLYDHACRVFFVAGQAGRVASPEVGQITLRSRENARS